MSFTFGQMERQQRPHCVIVAGDFASFPQCRLDGCSKMRRFPVSRRNDQCRLSGRHGIGVETHEEPYIVEGNTTVLEAGMAFSIEPGIYLPGRHGARIEDIVVATEGGIERLNVTDRRYVVLGG